MEKTESKIFLTGIKPTGSPHIGNWLGAIRPALEAAASFEARYFIADYHALNSVKDPAALRRNTYEVAAAWMACGLDPQKTLFYRQSDIPQVFELATLLSAFTPKGLMNRAHAYKAAVAVNLGKGEDPDSGVNMGLYTYPVLMAADILLFDADFVPVGKDQVQHIEIAVDIAEAVNRNYGKEIFRLPQPFVGETTQTVTGLDGRKMSKSYNNVIPLFEGGAKAIRDAIAQIKTDSRLPGEPKDPDSTSLTAIYEAFSTPEEYARFRSQLEAGMSWGDAKEALFNRIENEIGPMRVKYEALMADPAKIEAILQEGARKARALANPFIAKIREAVGLRNFADFGSHQKTNESKKKVALPIFKQYREKDGKFYFKLTSATGKELLHSVAFDSGRDCGQVVASLKCSGLCNDASVVAVIKEGETIEVKCVQLCPGVSRDEVQQALCALKAAEEEKRKKASN